jgi:hypothetical protein
VQKFLHLHYYFRRPNRPATGRNIDIVMPAKRRCKLRWNATARDAVSYSLGHAGSRKVRLALRDPPAADSSFPVASKEPCSTSLAIAGSKPRPARRCNCHRADNISNAKRGATLGARLPPPRMLTSPEIKDQDVDMAFAALCAILGWDLPRATVHHAAIRVI